MNMVYDVGVPGPPMIPARAGGTKPNVNVPLLKEPESAGAMLSVFSSNPFTFVLGSGTGAGVGAPPPKPQGVWTAVGFIQPPELHGSMPVTRL
jgi:hypothetical protein